ncbi:MAG: hypothetical protein OEV41_09980 [Gammaproteobacteria bacterium]|nr:hypothetical protein [Gammaproteobacteria bacterium]MDH5346217.1 hypothetical protein [Gammaproteobacteria bacterium]
MNTLNRINTLRTLAVALLSLALSACATKPPPCGSPATKNLDDAIAIVQRSLDNGCASHFDRYYDDLLTIAEGDPKPENKRIFSEFLVWASDEGLISQRQAKDYYNRYFNVKFVALASDYNNCSHTCPRRDRVMLQMERELSDKERGLLRVSLDNAGYYRADELYQEVELVLEATCTACEAGR